MRHMPIGMQIRKLQEYIVRNGYDTETFDLNALIDRTLNYRENRENIARLLGIQIAKTGKQQIAHEECNHLRHECEIRCDRGACHLYRKIDCQKEFGRVTGCGSDVHERVCPIPVRAFCVRPYERQYRDKIIRVSGHCRDQTMRKCT